MFQYRYPHPAVTTDIVLFTVADGNLLILLIERKHEPEKGKWALPGGFLEIDEELDACVMRELEEETGVSGIYLEQLHTFGNVNRDPRERVITVAHLAIIPAEKSALNAGSDAQSAGWFSIFHLPDLAFDHNTIISMACGRLITKLDYTNIAMQFMPEEFTLRELQEVYEIILERRIDKRNFRKSILALDCIVESGMVRRNGTHRPAKLYRLKQPGKVITYK